MRIAFEIIRITQRLDEVIDFNALIFRIDAPKRVDIDSSRYLWIFLKTVIDGGVRKIIIDMKNLEMIDSSGMGVLINAAKLVRGKKGDIILSNVSADVRKIFKIINLQEFIKMFNTDGEAQNHFRFL
ncbi:MAG TPA: STAS domain-containing protein [Spirochaetota bacterium]|mgnify:FL=1|nr:STAS domain-containing protein [Spirochaetota bacterium]HNT09836.1 STAS domain-containing protein [Spirochaetota bacterium]HNV46302.1 STAS domain-containing protein [Spirochaetota bacterium]HOS38117.1 STAS domain-containing protein [Spirochaetota bacterium]HPI21587.1 STAS domain-containing protein [Spirochaetota bacterium]